MFRRLRTLIAEALGVEESEVVPEASFEEDLNVDHQELLDLIVAVEEEFEAKVEDSEVGDLQTVGDLVDYLEDKLG